MGFLQYDPTPMTEADAEDVIGGRGDDTKAMFGVSSGSLRFDYLKGRVMKVDLSTDDVDTQWYNRDNGENAAEDAVAALRSTGDPNARSIQDEHYERTMTAAAETRDRLHERTTVDDESDPPVVNLGLDNVAHKLGPAIDSAVRKHA